MTGIVTNLIHSNISNLLSLFLHFSAPSGSYGTMTYMARAVALVLDCVPKHGEMECAIS